MEITPQMLPILILIPFLGFIFLLLARDDTRYSVRNIIMATEFIICTNIIMLGRFFSQLDIGQQSVQFLTTYKLFEKPKIELAFGLDVFSLMMLVAIHVIFLISIPFSVKKNAKVMSCLSLLMLGMMTGFLVSADIFSFYLFFAMPLIPLFLQIGSIEEVRKSRWMYRFFIYNFIGMIILFLCVCALYHYQKGENIIFLRGVARLRLTHWQEYWIWGGLFVAFVSRIPIWPFHYWIASMTSAIKNPLIFIQINLFPLTGVYGLIRFCPKTVPESVSYLLIGLEIIAAISMLFIAMIGLINKDNRYKLFSFITVYYIIYLQGALLPTSRILLNIGYSLFAFLIIMCVLELLAAYVREEQQKYDLHLYGIICNTPRLGFLYAFFTLSAVGFPLSALFVNNFVILSYVFNYNFNLGIMMMLALIIASASLLKELYLLKDNRYVQPGSVCIMDLSLKAFYGLSIIAILLLISFFNPLLILGV
ncbi:MAG: hypothetical protein IJ660_01525 [Alphaproteobacteria bacterium]|nr:hypothetical protein [Alphaproteobacteria bacterium]